MPRRRARAEGGAPRRRATCSPKLEAVRHRAERFFRMLAREPTGRRLGPGLDVAGAWRRRRRRSCSAARRRCAPRSWPCPTGPSRLTAWPARAQALRDELALRAGAAEDEPRLLRRDPRPRRLPEGDAHRRLGDACASCLFDSVRAAVLTSATLAVDGGFAYLQVAPRPRADATSCCCASPFDYRDAGGAVRAAAHARAALAGFRGARGGRGESRVARAEPRPRVRAVHVLRQHERGGRAQLAGEVPYPILMQGEAPKAVLLDTFRATRRARCCSPRLPSGRASTWPASSSRA